MMYVVSYDISGDKLRTKVAAELENFGKRVQYSVFECRLDRKRFTVLYQRLCTLMTGCEDGNIKIYRLCQQCENKIRIIGDCDKPEKTKDEEVIVI